MSTTVLKLQRTGHTPSTPLVYRIWKVQPLRLVLDGACLQYLQYTLSATSRLCPVYKYIDSYLSDVHPGQPLTFSDTILSATSSSMEHVSYSKHSVQPQTTSLMLLQMSNLSDYVFDVASTVYYRTIATSRATPSMSRHPNHLMPHLGLTLDVAMSFCLYNFTTRPRRR